MTEMGGFSSGDEFDQIMSRSGIDFGSGDQASPRLFHAVTQESVVTLNNLLDAGAATLTEAIGLVVDAGILTDDLNNREIPVIRRNTLTSSEEPFDTSTSIEHLDRETQIEVLDADHAWANITSISVNAKPETVAAIEIFGDRHNCDSDQAFNGLVRRGSTTIDALRTPHTQLIFEDPPGKRHRINFRHLGHDEA